MPAKLAYSSFVRLARLYARRGQFVDLRAHITKRAAVDGAQIESLGDRAKRLLYGDPTKPGTGWGWLAGEAPVALGSALYNQAIVAPAIARPGDAKVNAAVGRLLGDRGISVLENVGAKGNHFDPSRGIVGLTKRLLNSNSGILGHEAGHALGPIGRSRLASLLYGIGRPSLIGGSLGVAFSDSAVGGAGNAAMGMLGATPMMLEELGASARGYRLLRNMGAGRARALGAFIGLPTYAAALSSPLVLHEAKKHFNGYDN